MHLKLLNFLLVISLISPSYSSFAKEQTGIPRNPCQTGIPAPLRKPKDIIPLGCERPFTINGETYSADSPQAQDASTLKYFVQNVPAANSFLEEYQSNKDSSKMGAYVGTLGVLMFIFSNTIGKQFNAASKTLVTDALRVGGVCIAAGGFFFTFSHLHNNEHLISKSVDTYNISTPKNPIELQFTTGWKF